MKSKTKPPMDKLEQFKTDFVLDYQATEEQRDKSNEEYRFFTVPGGQWESFLEDTYTNRAKLELDQTSDYVYRTHGQWTQNRIGINYSPDDDRTSEDDAELLNGLYRRDFRRNNGTVALDNAVLEVFGSGIGALHISTEYDDKESIDDDYKNAIFKPFHNAYSMMAWDSSAKRVDKADAKRCTLVFEYSRDAFEREFPDAQVSHGITPNDRREFNWTSKTSVFVGCRYEIKKEKTTAYVLINPLTGQIEQVYAKTKAEEAEILKEAKLTGMELSRKKRIQRQYVVKSVFTGGDFIEEETRIPGKYIPVIPFYGYRAYVDGTEFYHGLVRKKMDAQRLVNMVVSLIAEHAATGSKRMPLFDPKQMEGLENLWGSDLSKRAYAVAKPIYDKQGNILHHGPTGYLEPSAMDDSVATLMEITSTFIQSGTGGAPQDTIDPDASGKAINAVLKRVDLNVQPILENIATGLKWAGEVYRWIANDIYTDKRSVKVVGEDGSEKSVTLMEDSVSQDTGNPITTNDVSRGRFEVVVDTGPAYETKREETVETLKDILNSVSEENPYHPIALAMLIEKIDGIGIEDFKNYVRKDLIIKGVKEPETDEEKAMLENMHNQEDPNAELMAAAAEQQTAEAQSLRAKSYKDLADAEKKRAEAVSIAEDIGLKKIETFSNVLNNPAPQN